MIDQPVVRLESNVYGHALAGLFWELKLEDTWLQEHWKKWNAGSTYFHWKDKLFLSVCADDIKMVGR